MNDKPLPQSDPNLPPTFVAGPHGRLATLSTGGSGTPGRPGLMWLGGYGSDMRGTKAEAIHAHAQAHKLPFCRFDYSGHGESDGAFEDGTISRWTADAQHMLDQATGPQVLIGSSMGGWIAGLLARQCPQRMAPQRMGPQKIAGLILIAPAPDFATALTPHQWPAAQWEVLQRDGRIDIPSPYDDTVMTYTKAMFDDGAQMTVLDQPLPIPCPVRILTGMKDDVVPWQHAVKYAEHMDQDDVAVTLVKDGDHRMSGTHEIALLRNAIDELAG